jgi:hypothetical protein
MHPTAGSLAGGQLLTLRGKGKQGAVAVQLLIVSNIQKGTGYSASTCIYLPSVIACRL